MIDCQDVKLLPILASISFNVMGPRSQNIDFRRLCLALFDKIKLTNGSLVLNISNKRDAGR